MTDIIPDDPLFVTHKTSCHIVHLLVHVSISPALQGLGKIDCEIFRNTVADASPFTGHAHCIKKAYYDNI
jgi:hypothetical protein